MEQAMNAAAPMTPVAQTMPTTPTAPTAPTPAPNNNQQKNNNALKIVTAIACAVAVCGIAFGVYGMVQSSRKDSRISDLETELNTSTSKIAGLEAESASLNNQTEENIATPEAPAAPEAEQPSATNAGTAAILLGDVLDENDSRTVFKVGECTADGPSVKCPVTVNGKDALLSYTTNDYILRLTLPND